MRSKSAPMDRCPAVAQVSCYHCDYYSERLWLPLSAATPTQPQFTQLLRNSETKL